MGQYGQHDNIKNRQLTCQRQDRGFHILDVEIDHDLESTCSSGLCDIKESDIPLHKYTDIPEFLQGNPFVTHGYRVALPFSLCLKSAFVWSNETLNIWSHFGGFFLFLFLMLYDNIIIIPNYNGGYTDHIIITLGLLCFQFCMLCSTGFHIFGCHSERASKRWLAVDLAGILIGVIGCYLPAVHYAFYCLSIWRDIYLICITVLSLSTLFVQFHPRYFSNTWFKQRIAIYFGLVAYGVIPTTHWIYLSGGFSEKIVQMFVPKVVTMYLLGALAFAFYISKFPERFFPGRFNYVGSSHQLWHIGMVVAFYWMNKTVCDIFTYRYSTSCNDHIN
ncbi:hypothetical protein CHS0354_034511 [Potamilus streckersoni]|uniref:Progestin and adipoQ receptor family member 3 n=1 Tax=Potamilus streckersoni TaxID=2493646 RepID=A0AAE0VVU9_9BIVA|nr:hypothetical protein CHS0354_034511 [Potamilus streckersoni]